MTPSELQHLRALCEQATPGPWRTVEVGLVRDKQTFTVLDANEMWVADCGAAPHDAAFIAAARSAVPALIEEVERLRAERNAARAAFGQLRNDVDGYDMCFEHARWIADGRPGSFAEWLDKYENQEWEPWTP